MEKTTASSAMSMGQTTLRLIQTTDVHGHILPYDYDTDSPDTSIGLAMAGRIIEQLRNDPTVVSLLLDTGDFLQGSFLTDVAAEDGDPSPMIAAMNALGYDAVTLGNHEFNFGLDALSAALEPRTFELVATNIRGFGQRTLLIERDVADGLPTLKIGVIGLAPPQILDWDRHTLGDRLTIDDLITSARNGIDSLREQGADVVVALCHSGIRDGLGWEASQNFTVQIAALDGVDAVLAGHLHELFPNPNFPASQHVDPVQGTVQGRPTVMSGHNASHVGQIDLSMRLTSKGWQIDSGRSALHPVADLPAETTPIPLPKLVTDAHQTSLSRIRTPLGRCDHHLHSFFSLVAPGRAMATIARAKKAMSEQLIKEAGIEPLPLLVSVAPLRSGGPDARLEFVDIPAGEVSRQHVLQLYPYPNHLVVVEMTGADVLLWLEQVAGLFNTAEPGRDVPATSAPTYSFDSLFGLTYTIDLTARPGTGRIRDLALNGAPLAPETRVHVTTNSFRVGGARPITAPRKGKVLPLRPTLLRDTVEKLFTSTDEVTCDFWLTWQFAPVQGAGLLFRSDPDAMRYVDASGLKQRITQVTPHPGNYSILRYALD